LYEKGKGRVRGDNEGKRTDHKKATGRLVQRGGSAEEEEKNLSSKKVGCKRKKKPLKQRRNRSLLKKGKRSRSPKEKGRGRVSLLILPHRGEMKTLDGGYNFTTFPEKKKVS